jgi:hypothetical protein
MPKKLTNLNSDFFFTYVFTSTMQAKNGPNATKITAASHHQNIPKKQKSNKTIEWDTGTDSSMSVDAKSPNGKL